MICRFVPLLPKSNLARLNQTFVTVAPKLPQPNCFCFKFCCNYMALINLPVIVILGGTAMKALNDYVAQRAAGKDPEFKASSIGLKEKTDFWN